MPVPYAWETLEIEAQVPEGQAADHHHLRSPANVGESSGEGDAPAPGPRTFKWDFKTEDGKDAGIGHFMYRVSIDGEAKTGMAVRPGRTSPEELGVQVVAMIKRYAPIARRSHDELMLPGADGKPVTLKSLFDAPRELMGAIIRGGWIVPGEPDRSMFLIAIVGTGPMQSEMAKPMLTSCRNG